MNFNSVGDLARLFSIRQSNLAIKGDVSRLTKEVTTGLKADVPQALNGDLMHLARIQTEMARAKAHQQSTTEASATASGVQTVIAGIQQIASESGSEFLSDTTLGSPHTLRAISERSAHQLRTVIDGLNSNIAGRFVFSGTRFSTPPIAKYDELIAQVELAASAAGTAADAIAAVDAWFDAAPGGGGFADNAFFGSASGAEPVEIGNGVSVQFATTASDKGFREVVKGLALAAMVSRGAFSGDQAEQAEMMRAAGMRLIEGDSDLSFVRADLGMTEQRIESAASRAQQTITGLTIERTSLIEADAYDSASKLIQAESQLEALYALTSKLSQRSLADYI